MISLVWWLRVVGVLFIVHFIAMVIARAPIRTLGPADSLDRAKAGDPLAKFLVDSWVIFGLENLAIGLVLLWCSGEGEYARALVWMVIAIEVLRGIVADVYMIVRTKKYATSIVWIVIHSVVIVTGLIALH